jgi:hypothetical protein
VSVSAVLPGIGLSLWRIECGSVRFCAGTLAVKRLSGVTADAVGSLVGRACGADERSRDGRNVLDEAMLVSEHDDEDANSLH